MSSSSHQAGLARTFGCIPDGCNAFTMHSKTITNPRKHERRVSLTKAQQTALALRSDEERKADRIKTNQARVSVMTATALPSGFNVPIGKTVLLGTSAKARAKAGI